MMSLNQTLFPGLYDTEKHRYNINKIYKRKECRNYFGDIELDKSKVESNMFCNIDKKLEFNTNVDLINLRTSKIVFLENHKLIGFITFSEIENVSEKKEYENEFKLIGLLIDIIQNNNEIMNQFDRMEKKLMNISTLYDVIANIQLSSNLVKLFQNLLSTISIVYQMTETMILKRVDTNLYEVIENLGVMNKGDLIEGKPKLYENNNKIIYDYTYENFESYFNSNLMKSDEITSNCLIVQPIDVKMLGVDMEVLPEYYLVVTRIEGGLKDQKIQSIEVIGKMISAIYKKYRSDEYTNVGDITKERFIEDLTEKIDDKNQFGIEFYLFYKKIKNNPFNRIDINVFDEECYIVENYAFYIGFDPNYREDFIKIDNIDIVEDFLDFDLK